MVNKSKPEFKSFIFGINKNNPLVWSITILFVSISVAFIYFYIKFGSNKNLPRTYVNNQSSSSNSATSYSDNSEWVTYDNLVYSYTVKYPSTLKETKELSTGEYLSFVSFLSPYGANNGGAAISVRGGELVDEIGNIKKTVLEESGARLISEIDIKKDKYNGKKLSFTIDGNNQLLPKTFYIVTKDGFVYTISCDSRYAEKFFEGFKFISK